MEIVPRRKNLSFLLQQVQQTEAPVCEGSVRLAEGERAMPGRQAGRQAERASSSLLSIQRPKEAGRERGRRRRGAFLRSFLPARQNCVSGETAASSSLTPRLSVGRQLARLDAHGGRKEEGGDLGWAQTRASLAATSLLRSAAADADGAAHTSNADLNERKSLVDRPRGR